PRQHIIQALHSVGIEPDIFTEIYSGQEMLAGGIPREERWRPKYIALQRIMRSYGLTNADILFVGDHRMHDMIAARHAKVQHLFVGDMLKRYEERKWRKLSPQAQKRRTKHWPFQKALLRFIGMSHTQLRAALRSKKKRK
ncbi:MAG: HAD family hydrolase, partial [Candidatus Diapherotrites archaeon]|nr:HAD family hydrolase [Candidatus Diapherotrites archaeon]